MVIAQYIEMQDTMEGFKERTGFALSLCFRKKKIGL